MTSSGLEHIGIFSLAFEPFFGGAEIAVKEITSRLDHHEFVCFTHKFDRRWPKQERIGNVKVIRLGYKIRTAGVHSENYYGHFWQKIFYSFLAWRAAERFHRRRKFSAIWAIMASYGGIAALLFKFRHPRIPLLLTLQEGDSEKHILRRVGIFYPFWKAIFKKADYIQAISNYLADFASRHGAKCPIEVIPNGVDLEKFRNQKPKIKTTDQKLKTIITTSRLVYKNGIDVLIRAIAELKNLRLLTPNFRLLILGSGPEEQKLKQLSRDLKAADAVEFLGPVLPEEIPAYLSQADIFVRPSRSEGLGSSFLEAMAAGLPVIGTRVGGIPDFLNGSNGLFVKTDDAKDLADKIVELSADNKLCRTLGRNGQKLIQEKYSWELIAQKIQTIFKSLVVSHKPRVSALIATGIYPPLIGGSASYSELLKRELPRYGFSVKVLTYGKRQETGVYGVTPGLPKGLRHLVYFFKVLKLGRSVNIILAADSSFGAATISALANVFLGRKLVVRVTGDYAWEQGQARFGITDLMDEFQKKRYGLRVELLRWLERFALRRANLVFTPSSYLKKISVGWGVNENRVKVIYNAIAMPPKISKAQARNKLDLTGKIILTAGRLVPWKGFEALITAFNNLKGEFQEARLVILGAGPEKRKLEALIQEFRLAGRTDLVKPVSKETLGAYLSAADMFVLNTGYEGLSHQLIEAISYGLPIITTSAGGNQEVIDKLPSSRIKVVPYNDISALQEAMRKFLRSTKQSDQSVDLTGFTKLFSKKALLRHVKENLESLL